MEALKIFFVRMPNIGGPVGTFFGASENIIESVWERRTLLYEFFDDNSSFFGK